MKKPDPISSPPAPSLSTNICEPIKSKLESDSFEDICKCIASPEIKDDQVVIKSQGFELMKKSFNKLSAGWLNDECINAYVHILNSHPQSSCFAFNTFFYTMLEDMRSRDKYDFNKLNRIVSKKKVKLRECTNVLVPINIKNYHWLLLNCNLVENTFYVLDSMGTDKPTAD